MIRSAILVLACLFVACSGSDGSSAIGDSDAGTSSSSGDGGSNTGVYGDAGGCTIMYIGPNQGTAATSTPRSPGAAAWQSPSAAIAEDGTFATVALAPGQESEELTITNYGFHLPPGNTFMGVEVELKRQSSDASIVDGGIRLVGVPNQTSRPKYIATPWPTKIVGTHHYGQATDTWGMDLNAPDVETPNFGVGLWVKRDTSTADATATANVESIRVRVFYCP